jgi:hypothetical protein
MFGEVGFAIQKLDSRNGINKEPSRSVTQQVDVFVARPPLQLMPPREFGKFVFQEESNVVLIREGWTSCRTKTSVESTRRGRRNPVLIRGSGLPVIKT